MEGFVAQKLNDFETGKISRRKLIETLTFAATTVYAADEAKAQSPEPTLKAQLINHFSYTCPNFKDAADWYSKFLNLDQVGSNRSTWRCRSARRTSSPTASPRMTCRSRISSSAIARSPAPRRSGDQPRLASQAMIDHIGFTVADFNSDRAKAELTALGVKNVREAGSNSVHMDDAFGYDVQISGLEATALSGRLSP